MRWLLLLSDLMKLQRASACSQEDLCQDHGQKMTNSGITRSQDGGGHRYQLNDGLPAFYRMYFAREYK